MSHWLHSAEIMLLDVLQQALTRILQEIQHLNAHIARNWVPPFASRILMFIYICMCMVLPSGDLQLHILHKMRTNAT